MTARLSRATLAEVLPRPGVRAPGPRPAAIGVVHLGVGAFHRAHQAVFTEDAALASGEDRWGILGVSQRSDRAVRALRPQDALYGLLEVGRGEPALRLCGSLADVAYLRAEPRVLDAIADVRTHVVTLTVSEKGYRRTPTGDADLTDPDLAADVAALVRHDDAPARTPIGALVRGLALRFRRHGAPVTIVCCDNMVGNGRVVAHLVGRVLGAADGTQALRAWVGDHVGFPSTMVDRITPVTTERHHAQAEALLGLHDEALVVAEPYRQWVIEDVFTGPRPRWELAGAVLTDDVAPYEQVKLRLLNGAHSAVAYLGALRGHVTIDAALADQEVRALAVGIMDDAEPTLRTPDGLDLADYRARVLERFANPVIGYTTLQVAGDGSQKLPIRVLGTVADRLAAGVVPQAATRVAAAWAVMVARRRDVAGRPLPLDDPLADVLRQAAAGTDAGLADRMLDVAQVFPEQLAGHDGFRAAFRREVADLARLH